MAEVQFAKSFLAALDRKPVKVSSDFVSDPKKYPSQSPFILPKPSHPFLKRQKTDNASTKQTVSVTLKPTKGPSEPVTLDSQDPQTTVLDLKTQYAAKSNQDISKIKLLYNKRPASDLKTLKELLPDPTPATAELSVMVLGGGISSPAATTPAVSSPAVEVPDPTTVPTKKEHGAPLSERAAERATTTDPAAHAADVLKSEQFWGDLKDFLVQRLRDEGEGERLLDVFRKASDTR